MLQSIIAQTFDATTFTAIGVAGFLVMNFFVRYTQTRSQNACTATIPAIEAATEVVTEPTVEPETLAETVFEAIAETLSEPVFEPETVVEVTVEPENDSHVEPETLDTPDFQSMTIRELKAIAKAQRIPNYSRLVKAQLVQALSQL